MKRKIFAIAMLVAVCGHAQQAGLGTRLFDRSTLDPTQPMTITSQRFEFDYKQLVAIFDADVKVAHPQFYLEADLVFVFITETNDVKNILAQGNVLMTNETSRAECDWALYTREEGTLVMKAADENGVAKITHGKDLVTGPVITFWLDDERMTVEGGFGGQLSPETLRQNREEKPAKEPEEKSAEDAPEKPKPSLYKDPEAKKE